MSLFLLFAYSAFKLLCIGSSNFNFQACTSHQIYLYFLFKNWPTSNLLMISILFFGILFLGEGQEYWEEENIIEEMPACRQMFNIFHPFDPVAYRSFSISLLLWIHASISIYCFICLYNNVSKFQLNCLILYSCQCLQVSVLLKMAIG